MSRALLPCFLCFLLLLLSLGRLGWAAPAASAAEAAPAILFSAHDTLHGKQFMQGGQTYGREDRRTAPLSLPAGRYWFYIDYHSGPQSDFASMRLRGPDDLNLPNTEFTVPTYWTGRGAKEVTLTEPFTGTVEYGGGGLASEELWFFIVPADKGGFLPFGFGAVPKPLKKGAINAIRGTFSSDIGDYYYFSLPAGSWQVSLVVTVGETADAAAPRASSLLTAAVELLDERGVQKMHTEANGSASGVRLISLQLYDMAGTRAEDRQVFQAETAGYAKFHVMCFPGKSESVPASLHYTLALSPAAGPVPPKP